MYFYFSRGIQGDINYYVTSFRDKKQEIYRQKILFYTGFQGNLVQLANKFKSELEAARLPEGTPGDEATYRIRDRRRCRGG